MFSKLYIVLPYYRYIVYSTVQYIILNIWVFCMIQHRTRSIVAQHRVRGLYSDYHCSPLIHTHTRKYRSISKREWTLFSEHFESTICNFFEAKEWKTKPICELCVHTVQCVQLKDSWTWRVVVYQNTKYKIVN